MRERSGVPWSGEFRCLDSNQDNRDQNPAGCQLPNTGISPSKPSSRPVPVGPARPLPRYRPAPPPGSPPRPARSRPPNGSTPPLVAARCPERHDSPHSCGGQVRTAPRTHRGLWPTAPDRTGLVAHRPRSHTPVRHGPAPTKRAKRAQLCDARGVSYLAGGGSRRPRPARAGRVLGLAVVSPRRRGRPRCLRSATLPPKWLSRS